MEYIVAFLIGILLMGTYEQTRNRLIVRIFPEQEAKRRISALRGGRRWHKRYLRNPVRAKILTAWVDRHPENSIAQDLQRAEVEASIRNEQELKDRLESDRAMRIAETRRLDGMKLEWSLENPSIGSANRYLTERLEELRERRDSNLHTVEHCKSMLSVGNWSDAERADFQFRLNKAKTELDSLEQSICEIELSLGVDALGSQ